MRQRSRDRHDWPQLFSSLDLCHQRVVFCLPDFIVLDREFYVQRRAGQVLAERQDELGFPLDAFRFEIVDENANQEPQTGDKHLSYCTRDFQTVFPGLSGLFEVNAALGYPIGDVLHAESLKLGTVMGSADFDFDGQIQVIQCPLNGCLQ